MKNFPYVSVIIPTYNRGEALCKTLKSLFRQNYNNYEIIVIDHSTKKFSQKEEFLKENAGRISYYFFDVQTAPVAKNLGLKKAKGKIILFCDDDIKAKSNLISAHVANYADSTIAGVSGRVITLGQKTEPEYPKVGKISHWGTVAGGFSSKIRQEIGNVLGCNVSWRKEILEEIGSFDENFIGNAIREETDLALRIKNLGVKIIFDPNAQLTHLRTPTGGGRKDENRLGWYHDFFHNETYFFLKHINWYWWPVFWLTRWQWFLRCMFGFGREVSLRSLKTPWLGIYHGIQTYRRWKSENRG